LYINQSIKLLINPFCSNVNFSHFYQLIVVLVTAAMAIAAQQWHHCQQWQQRPCDGSDGTIVSNGAAMAVMAWGWQWLLQWQKWQWMLWQKRLIVKYFLDFCTLVYLHCDNVCLWEKNGEEIDGKNVVLPFSWSSNSPATAAATTQWRWQQSGQQWRSDGGSNNAAMVEILEAMAAATGSEGGSNSDSNGGSKGQQQWQWLR
jgi:hypothetical protein